MYGGVRYITREYVSPRLKLKTKFLKSYKKNISVSWSWASTQASTLPFTHPEAQQREYKEQKPYELK